MTDPTPIPTASSPLADPTKKPFAKTAAKFCAWSPLIAIVVHFFCQGYIGATIQLLGVIMGVVALCGVSKHGRKGIVIPALIGITINIGLLVLAMTMYSALTQRAKALQEKSQHANEEKSLSR